MARILEDDFGEGRPISAVGSKWFNAVAKFINGLTGKNGVKIRREGQFPTIELDLNHASEKTTPSSSKGLSAHTSSTSSALVLADFYDYPDKVAHPQDPSVVFPEWQALLDMPGDHEPPSRMTGADNTTPVGWERGKTAWKNGVACDESHPPVGCSMTVCTHFRQILINGTAKHQALFSRLEFDEHGMLVRAVPCTNWYTLM